MTAHKHAEMIKAKADNMDSMVFIKNTNNSQWLKLDSNHDLPAFNENLEYFLCHPKHERECLHWLNGGEVDIHEGESEKIKWTPINLGVVWGEYHPLMSGSLEFRIKPRKEKRWIVVKNGMLQSNHLFECDNEAADVCGLGGQFIEIEVEV